MSNESESKALMPITLDNVLNPEKKINLSNRPHLERLSALVFVFMQAKARFDEQGKRWFQESQEQNIDLAKLLDTEEFQTLWPISETQTGVEIPELMADKIHAIGNPFGFTPGATRAALEMAFILSSNQMMVDIIEKQIPGGTWSLDPTEYFQETVFQMYHSGRTVGTRGFSHTLFPAHMYWDELFPPEVGRQIERLEKSPK